MATDALTRVHRQLARARRDEQCVEGRLVHDWTPATPPYYVCRGCQRVGYRMLKSRIVAGQIRVAGEIAPLSRGAIRKHRVRAAAAQERVLDRLEAERNRARRQLQGDLDPDDVWIRMQGGL